MRRSVGELWIPEEAAPRVYIDGEPEPELTYFNPLVPLTDDHPGAEYERLAVEPQHRAWNDQHPDALPALRRALLVRLCRKLVRDLQLDSRVTTLVTTGLD